MPIQNKVTVQEIANEAGVSIATVSRILNHKDNIKEETRKKVYNAMKKMDFRPDLSNGITNFESKLILMSVSEFSNPFISNIIKGAQASALRRGYHLLLYQSDNIYNSIGDYESLLKNNPIAGFILLSNLIDTKLLERLSFHYPVVMCSEYCEGCDISYVSINDFTAAKSSTDYLISIGRKKIALMNSSMEHKYAHQRESGYIASLRNASIDVNESWIIHLSSVNFDIALSSAEDLLSSENRPDAFFAVSDIFAASIIKACNKLRLSVPKDVAVIGFDNIDISRMTAPTITTVNQPSFQMGFQACDLLIDKINNPGMQNKQILLDTELIVRGSTQI